MNHPRPNGQQMSELGYSNQVCLTLTRTVVFLFFLQAPGFFQEGSMETLGLEVAFER